MTKHAATGKFGGLAVFARALSDEEIRALRATADAPGRNSTR